MQQSHPLSLKGSKMKSPRSARKEGALYHTFSVWSISLWRHLQRFPLVPITDDYLCLAFHEENMSTVSLPKTAVVTKRGYICSFQYDDINIKYPQANTSLWVIPLSERLLLFMLVCLVFFFPDEYIRIFDKKKCTEQSSLQSTLQGFRRQCKNLEED